MLGHFPCTIASKLQQITSQIGFNVSLASMDLGKAKSNSCDSPTGLLVVMLLIETTVRLSLSVWGAASPCRAKRKGATFFMFLKDFLKQTGCAQSCLLATAH